MRKIFTNLAVLAVVFLIVSCGGSTSSSNDNANTGDNSDESDSQKCESGKFKCVESESHYCNTLGKWVYDARCENGCDSSTGKCKSDSNNDDIPDTATATDTDNDTPDSVDDNDPENFDDSDNNSDCTENSFRCNNGFSQKCNSGKWQNLEECNYGCDTSTGKCKQSNDSDESGCTTGKYKCSDTNSQSFYCNDGYWTIYESCSYGCDVSTGKCKSAECTTGEYKCNVRSSNNTSYYCNNGVWKIYENCDDECNSSTGKCKESCYKIDNKTWSSKSAKIKNLEEALEYCNNLTACGHSDWHLPNIDELRTLIKNCPGSETGGVCKVSENNDCLTLNDGNCWIEEDCWSCSSSVGDYSKLGDYIILWSSSIVTDVPDDVWMVLFENAWIGISRKENSPYNDSYARCVR